MHIDILNTLGEVSLGCPYKCVASRDKRLAYDLPGPNEGESHWGGHMIRPARVLHCSSSTMTGRLSSKCLGEEITGVCGEVNGDAGDCGESSISKSRCKLSGVTFCPCWEGASRLNGGCVIGIGHRLSVERLASCSL